MKFFVHLTWFVYLCFFSLNVTAQMTDLGYPYYSYNTNSKSAVHLPDLQVAKAELEDKENPLYSLPTAVNLSLENAGSFQTLSNGDRVWHLEINSTTGYGIAVFYEDFYLPPGAQLFMYDEDKKQVKGAYTAKNNKISGKFFTGFIHGKKAILEYYEPAAVRGEGHFTIFRIDRQIQAEAKNALNLGFGTASECHLNAACPEANEYNTIKKGVCRIMMTVEEGTAWCSGSLINNTNEDETPYVLTAFHCTDGYTPMYDLWRFDFNYESQNCENPNTEPTFQSVVGCTYRAGRAENDFQLVEITEDIPAAYNVYFNGWDRSNSTPQNLTLLHHPSADIKKYSHDQHQSIIHPFAINWNNDVTTPANRHFRCVLEEGSFEIGSSGCAVFNQNKLIVGQLHGGNPGCENATIYAGRLHHAWDDSALASEQLAVWLDPANTQAQTLSGIEPVGAETAVISGQVLTPTGSPVAGVTVRANGEEASAVITDSNGLYTMEMPTGAAYTLSFEKNYNNGNGVFTSDIIKMRRVVLTYEDYDSPYSIIAADVNGTNAWPSTADIVVIRQFILNLIDVFPNNVPSWRFVPAAYVFPNENDPWLEPIPSAVFVSDLQSDITNVNIVAIKTGDPNNSADGQQ